LSRLVSQNIINIGLGIVVPIVVVISVPLGVCLTTTFLYGLPPIASSYILDTMNRVASVSALDIASWYRSSPLRFRCSVFSEMPSRSAMSRLDRPVPAALVRNSLSGIAPLRKTLPRIARLVFFLAAISRPVGNADLGGGCYGVEPELAHIINGDFERPVASGAE